MKKALYFFSINPNISFFHSKSYFISSTVSPARERGSAEREGAGGQVCQASRIHDAATSTILLTEGNRGEQKIFSPRIS